ncbi:hypothetical protein Tco_0708808, partial [Tanacetum coccineum]
QAAARDEKWVPFTERVEISYTNIRLETTVPEKEEIFQVVIDLIKNSTCFKAFTISEDVLEIFMQQFWYTIKKVQGTDSYEFLLSNKKCTVNADVFRKIFDICPKVKGVNFTELPNDDTTLVFLIELGYKGPLYTHTNMFVDHMHQPWRTLAAIINKCLFGKTASNDKLRKSRIDILWGMLYRENIDYPKLIWEDLAFQIDHMKEKRSRRKNMPFPRFTKIIIDHFLKKHKSLSKLKYQHYHTIKDDGIVSRLKFVRIREDYQEYGLLIPDVMLTDAIKQSESYQMFIKYSTGQIPPKKNRGKGSQGKKTIDTRVTDVDVSKESKPEPARKRTTSKRRVKKKVTISADDNIIPDLDVALELGKSISLTEAKEEEAARQVHATHARIVTKSIPEPARRRPSGKMTSNPPKKLKSVLSLTPEEQEAADTIKALKESTKTIRRQPGTRGSIEGIGSKPGVPNESTVVSATSSEGTGAKPGVLDEEKVTTEENVILEWGSEQESEYSEDNQGDDDEVDWINSDDDEEKKDNTHDDKSIDLETTDDEETEDEFVHGEEQVNDDEDEEMTNAEVADSDKDDEEVTDAAKAYDTTNAEINSVLEVNIQPEVPHIQSPSILRVLVSVIFEPSVLTPIQETSFATPVTTLPPPSVSTIPHVPLQQQTTAPILAPPPTTESPTIIAAILESNALTASQVPTIVDDYLGSRLTLESSKIQFPTINLEQEYAKIILEILKIKKQKMPKYTIKSTDKAALKEYDLKSALYQTMHANKSFNKNPANHRLYHALIKALIEDENAMDKGVTDTNKRRRTKESKSSKKPSTTKENPKGKAPSKGSKTGKSASAKEPVEEPIAEVVMDDVGEDEVRDDDQPQDTSEPKTDNTRNPEWFKQPPRPPTPDPEWNKH